MEWRSRGRSIVFCLAVVFVVEIAGCAQGKAPVTPLTCNEEVASPVFDCVAQRFVEEGDVGWRLDLDSVLDLCVLEFASIPCDADGGTCTTEAPRLVTQDSWPDVCGALARDRFDPTPTAEAVDPPPALLSALEAARAKCPAGTCRLAASAFVVDFGGRPSILRLDSAIDIARTRIQAPQTWELHIGVIRERSLPIAAIETIFEPFGQEGMSVVQALAAQSGQQIQFARFERERQERREVLLQQAIVTLASQGESNLLIMIEVDLTAE